MNIGIIGGSGLYDIDGLKTVKTHDISTPFGNPSDQIMETRLGDQTLYFLPRHGRGHTIMPSEINHRANICAMKMLKATAVMSVSAVGSLREDYRPRDLVVPDQYFDRTKQSVNHTFFGNGVVGHVPFGDPLCDAMRHLLLNAAQAVVDTESGDSRPAIHDGGTYVNMEGPAFSTRAESEFYRSCGFDIIGMTSLPEAKLCREAGLCYAPLALVTDYDCWNVEEGSVDVATVIGHLQANISRARHIITALEPLLPLTCVDCAEVGKKSVITAPEACNPEALEKLQHILS